MLFFVGKVRFEKTTHFCYADQLFGIYFTFLGNTRPIWKRFFAFFNSSVGPLGSGAYKNEHNLQSGALKVTKSEFFDGKCVSFVSLCGAMGEDLVEILISHGF